jgi:hypothetical protein
VVCPELGLVERAARVGVFRQQVACGAPGVVWTCLVRASVRGPRRRNHRPFWGARRDARPGRYSRPTRPGGVLRSPASRRGLDLATYCCTRPRQTTVQIGTLALTWGNRVGLTGFEPAASSSRTKRATKLRHSPIVGAVPTSRPSIPVTSGPQKSPSAGGAAKMPYAW